MQVRYHQILKLGSALTLLSISGPQGAFLGLQGGVAQKARLKKLAACPAYFAASKSQLLLRSVSVSLKGTYPAVLFEYAPLGPLGLFLKGAASRVKYQIGLNLGRELKLLHEAPCPASLIKKSTAPELKALKKLNCYLRSAHRFHDDAKTLEALTARFKSFKRPHLDLRLGALKLENVLIGPDLKLKLIPAASFGPGDRIADLASLCADAFAEESIFCAGVIDGYTAFKASAVFWLSFGLYSALLSLTRFNAVMESLGPYSEQGQEALFKSRLLRASFADFTKPIPDWYLAEEVTALRQQARHLGW